MHVRDKGGKRSKESLPPERTLSAVVLERGTEERAGVGFRILCSTSTESEDLDTKALHPKRPLIVTMLVRLFPPH